MYDIEIYNSAISVILNGDNAFGRFIVEDWTPASGAARRTLAGGAPYGWQPQPASYGWELVEDEIVVTTGRHASLDELLQAQRRLDAIFEDARRRRMWGRGHGAQAFLFVQPEYGGRSVESEILDGATQVDALYMDCAAPSRVNPRLRIRLLRRPFWATPQPATNIASASLTNRQDANGTMAGIASGILGDADSLPYYRIKNTSTDNIYKIWLGVRKFNPSDGGNPLAWLMVDVGDTANSTANGGYYSALASTTTTDWNSAPIAFTYTIAGGTENIRKFRGCLKPLVRFWQTAGAAGAMEFLVEYKLGSAQLNSTWIRSEPGATATVTAGATEKWQIVELGPIAFPYQNFPSFSEVADSGLAIRLKYRSVDGSAVAGNLDYLLLFPADGYARIDLDQPLEANGMLHLSCFDYVNVAVVTRDEGGTQKATHYPRVAGAVPLLPAGNRAAVAVLVSQQYNYNKLGQTVDLRVTSYPRWLSFADSGTAIYRSDN